MNSSQMLSIIIPAYNAERWIVPCVESALSSYSGKKEVICVDDGSTDSTPDLIEGLAASNPEVRCIHQANQGRCAARNAGIDRAAGAWLTFLDADDRMIKESVDVCIEAMRGDVSLVCSVGIIEDGHETACSHGPRLNYDVNRVELSNEEAIAFLLNPDGNAFTEQMGGQLEAFNSLWCSAVYAKLYSTSYIKDNGIRFIPNLKFGEDLLFVYSYLSGNNKEVVFIPTETYVYNTKNEGTIRGYRRGDADKMINTVSAWYDIFLKSAYKKQIATCCIRNVLFLSVRAAQFCSSRHLNNELSRLISCEKLHEIASSFDNKISFPSSTVEPLWKRAALSLSKGKTNIFMKIIRILGIIQKIKKTLSE